MNVHVQKFYIVQKCVDMQDRPFNTVCVLTSKLCMWLLFKITDHNFYI